VIVLGLHGGITIRQHEPAAAVIVDGKIVAVCEEERYTRTKSCYGMLPQMAIVACLRDAGISMHDVDLVATPGSTYQHFDTIVADYLRHNFGYAPPIQRFHHQLAHVAAAFYGSGYTESLCLSLDASGDGTSGLLAYAHRDSGIVELDVINNSSSIGRFYTLMTYYLGFADGDEYKVMGLAPYGRPEIDLSAVIRVVEGGWEFNNSFVRDFPPLSSPFEAPYSERLPAHLGMPHRLPGGEMTPYYRNVASSTQHMLEEGVLSVMGRLSRMRPSVKSLCYAGGVAMNCVANQRLVESGLFEHIYIPPVTSDRGLALGCAYLGAVSLGDHPESIPHAYLGSAYDDNLVHEELTANGCTFVELEDPAKTAAELIAQGRIIGWHQGRSEAGARALGNRSILARPGGAEVRDQVNARIKFRESFRPFAPAVIVEEADRLFVLSGIESPYMCSTFQARQAHAESLAAVVHMDGSARVQTVDSKRNPLFHSLIRNYHHLTDTPVVLNTSFNLKGQPIVETPRDALMTFSGCGLDDLIIGRFRISKSGQR
jgi:carbamoyltransferase